MRPLESMTELYSEGCLSEPQRGEGLGGYIRFREIYRVWGSGFRCLGGFKGLYGVRGLNRI